jgi:hypothetical protein
MEQQELTGRAAELAQAYQKILDSPTYETDDNLEQMEEIEMEMDDLGYRQNAKRRWVKKEGEK